MLLEKIANCLNGITGRHAATTPITLAKEISVTGNGLMTNQPCEVTFFPSEEGKIRYFVEGKEGFVADINSVVSTNHCVTIGSKTSQAMLTEHLTAALAFCGINSLDIRMSSREVPALDGSAKSWVELFKQAGIKKPLLYRPQRYTVSEPIYYLNGKTSLVILPDKELFISYAVNYEHPELKNCWVNFNPKNADEIIEARTFGYFKDLKKFQMLGFARGVTKENTVGLLEEGFTTELRSDKEPVKHKILDLIGDLYLTGVNPLDLRCQILVKEAGHAVHLKVAEMMKDKLIECK